jgi:hypothetical protein
VRRCNTWTWTAIEVDSKILGSWLVGDRDGEYVLAFIDDLRQRLANRVQLTSDGHKAYLEAVEEAFGDDIDYAMLVKLYGTPPEAESAIARLSASARGARISPHPKTQPDGSAPGLVGPSLSVLRAMGKCRSCIS